MTNLRHMVRRHWVLGLLLALGAALRYVVLLAYRPVLIVIGDSPLYLQTASTLEPHRLRPIGYSAFLRLLPIEGRLSLVAGVQHAIGLAMALMMYALLLRLGVRRGIAAVAAAPLLLDAMQLNIEQHVVAETLFEALVLGGIAALLWHERPTWTWTGCAGLLFAAALLTRSNGLLIIVPAVLAVLFLRGGVTATAALLGAFLVPVAAYSIWFHSYHDTYGLTDSSGRWLYGRVATFVDCAKVQMPPHERQLCPQEPLGQRLSPDKYVWGVNESPRYTATAPPGMTLKQVESNFSKRVVRAQPVEFMSAVAFDLLRGFAPQRTSRAGEASVERWKFQKDYPVVRFPPYMRESIAAYGFHQGRVDAELAALLVTYQRAAFTPGPLLLAALLAASMVFVGFGRVRDLRLRVAAFLFAGVTLAYLAPAAIITFSWRYQVLQLLLLPPAAALAYTALATRRRPERA